MDNNYWRQPIEEINLNELELDLENEEPDKNIIELKMKDEGDSKIENEQKSEKAQFYDNNYWNIPYDDLNLNEIILEL